MSTVRLPCPLPLPLPLVVASPQHPLEYERIAYAVRDQTTVLYHHFLLGKPTVDATRWKSVKQRARVEVFVARARHPPTAFHAPLTTDVASPALLLDADWVPQLQLRLVGQTPGSLEDAMYGMVAPTEMTMLKRSAATGDNVVDHRTLLDIRPPTPDAPFTSTRLTWSFRSSKSSSGYSLAKAEDLTCIEASGFTTVLCNGKHHRVGFVVTHSVKLAALPSHAAHGVMRARISVCTLFRQASAGVVEVFATSAVSPGGDQAVKTTTTLAAETLLIAAQMPAYAVQKRLVHMHLSPRIKTLAVDYSARTGSPSRVGKSRCAHCLRSLSALRSSTTCKLCNTHVCSKCITTQKLVYGQRTKREIRSMAVAICNGCITTATNATTAVDLAVHEFVTPSHEQRERTGRASTSSSRCSCSDMPSAVHKETSRRPSYASTQSSFDEQRSPVAESTTTSSFGCSRIEEIDPVDLVHYTHPPYPYGAASASPSQPDASMQHQLYLWQQMNELCLQAEHTYQQTKEQAQVVHRRFQVEE